MSSIRLSLVCAVVLGLGADSARAQYFSFNPSFGAPYSWWNVAPYSYYGAYSPYGMRWQYPGAIGTANPWAIAPWYSYQASWTTTSGAYQPYGRPVRARDTLYPAISYRDMLTDELRNAALDDGTATITVYLPGSATLSINDKQMTQRATERTFVTPQLPSAGKYYTFELRASWTDALSPRTQVTTLQVRSGRSYSVTFPLARKD